MLARMSHKIRSERTDKTVTGYDKKIRLQEPTILEPYNASARHHLSIMDTIH